MFTRVSSLLRDSLQRLGIAPQVRARQVIEATNAFLHHTLTLHHEVKAVRFSHRLITIRVDHPAAAEIIRQHEQALLGFLREEFPRQAFLGLRYTRAPTA